MGSDAQCGRHGRSAPLPGDGDARRSPKPHQLRLRTRSVERTLRRIYRCIITRRTQTDSTATDIDDQLVETAQQLADVGVTYLYFGVARPVAARAEFLDEVARMGETLVPRIATIPVIGG